MHDCCSPSQGGRILHQSFVGAQFIAPAFRVQLGVMNHAPTFPSCDSASESNTMKNMSLRFVIVLLAGFAFCVSPAQALELDAAAEAKRLEAGLTRLCGVWDWTVHSHSANHRESKAKIVLPSTQAAGMEGPSPTEIRIYGDAVYFRWDFPGGDQEDSKPESKP